MLNILSAWLIRALSMSLRSLGWRACRFHPTCSEYASQSLADFSWPRAMRLSLGRFLRCQPFSRGGFDPVPGKGR
jgi:uncharacterized protein